MKQNSDNRRFKEVELLEQRLHLRVAKENLKRAGATVEAINAINSTISEISIEIRKLYDNI